MGTVRDYVEHVRSKLGELAPSSLTEDDIDQIEEDLGITLPPSYRELVLSCDGEEFYGTIYWLGDDVPDHFSMIETRGAMEMPSFLLPLIDLGDGDLYCFDTRYPDDAGEYPLVVLNHELDNKRRRKFKGAFLNLAMFLTALMRGSGKSDNA
jgi:hypothetical protein